MVRFWPYQRRMVQRQIVIVPPPGGDSGEVVSALRARLSAAGLEASSLALGKVGEAPEGATIVFFYRDAEAVMVEAMASGTQPSAAMGPWTRQAGRILSALAATSGAVTADIADIADQGEALAAVLAVRGGTAAASAAEPTRDDMAAGEATGGEPDGQRPVRRTLGGDPVLRALARAALQEMPKARKYARELAASSLLVGIDGPRADTAYLYYRGIARRPGDEEAAERLEAECARLRARLAALEAGAAPSTSSPPAATSGENGDRAADAGMPLTALGSAPSVPAHPVARPAAAPSLSAGDAPSDTATRLVLGETFSHPAFYDLEQSRHGRVFRWLGREDEAVIPTHTTIEGAVRVDVTVEVAVDDAALEGLRIGLNGTYADAAEIHTLANGQRVKSALFADGGGRPVDVWLGQRHVVDLAGKGDRRRLGCGIASVTVAPAGTHADTLARATAVRSAAATPAGAEPVAAAGAPATAAQANLSRQIVLEIDADFDEPAFYPAESLPGGGAFAWIGRAKEEWLPVTVALDRPIRVDAHLAMVIDPSALDGFEFTLDGQVPAEYRVETGTHGTVKSATFTFDDPSRTRPELIRLVLRANHAVDMSAHGDERCLSVGLSKLVLTRL